MKTRSFNLILILSLLLSLLGSALTVTPAHAASITVTTTADTIDAAGTCSAVTVASLPGADGQTTLREAVCAANNNAGADIITFSVNGTFTLTGAANEDNGGSGDLDIKNSLTIQGNGTSSTIIDGGGIDRIFDVFPSAASTFSLSAIKIQNGDTRSTSFKEGGAIYLHNNVTTTLTDIQVINNFSGANGAIENRGSLTISGSVISGNQTIPTSGSVTGGAIHNAGTLTIDQTTIDNNSVRGEGGGVASSTGAAVVVNITNSTISNNTASVTGGGLGNGGGISTTGNQGTINITNSTISNNHADNNGGGAYLITPGGGTGNYNLTNVTITNNVADNDNNNTGTGGGFTQNTATVILKNTIVAKNSNSIASVNDDITGAVSGTSSYNLIGDGTGASGLSHGVNNNQVGSNATPIDPLLGVLQNNGGQTQTHSLITGSSAIDAGANCPAADQRGVVRPQGVGCDIGSFESIFVTVTFNANGGSGSMSDQTASSPTALTTNTFTRAGYSFSGWNTAANGSGTAYADGATYDFSADVTLYAQWTANTYTVTFNANGGSGSMSDQVANVPTALTTNTFTRVGYSFSGWNTASNGSGTSYADGATYDFSADVTLYAQWTNASSTLIVKSVAASDGWVLESSETSNLGGFMKWVTDSLVVGDDAADRQYRSFLHFDTSALPDNAVITSVVLRLREAGINGSDPFPSLGQLRVDMIKPAFGAPGVELSDFQAVSPRVNIGSITEISPSLFSSTLNNAARTYLNKTGSTQLRLYFSIDDNDNNISDFIRFYSGEAPSEYRPKLIITYTLP